jgi:hypothetical protein
MQTAIYNDELRNLMEKEFLYSNSKQIIPQFAEYLKENNDEKLKRLKILKEIKKEILNYKKDLSYVTISEDILKKNIWTVKEEGSIVIDHQSNDLTVNDIDEIPRTTYTKTMEEDELDYLLETDSNSLGNILEYIKITKNRNKAETNEFIRLYGNDAKIQFNNKNFREDINLQNRIHNIINTLLNIEK